MNEMERFQGLPPAEPREMIGLWTGRGMPSGHPLDGVLENLGWFGKRFSAQMRVDALLFRGGENRLVAIDPAWIPLRLALRFHKLGRTRAASNLFSYLLRRLRAKGPVASLKAMQFHGVTSAAMAYDTQPIIDHFRKVDDNRVMGAMVIEGDDRVYFFELQRVEEM
ncbi:DUF4334 domain-containing protein [Agrobacterium sp. a22-2]|uniref:DUF4334 domain-containing protein n=1 Tax=Agrobacterium sp. a22-2 TaxID=2283840 RepID=UPI001444D59E|nr:DUF4334 domain-containing protein [Agrobacterium sp. a22-2]NKN39024.1 DUF4334 domain-containing protein [Agrobacterium sp. a22-2]